MLLASVTLVAVARPTLAGYLVGLALVVAGQAVRFWASGYIAKSESLATSGPYSVVRNPLYVGSLLIACGYCAMAGGWIVWVVVIPLYFAIHGSAVMWEERYLRSKFGEPFVEYCRRVPRWFPMAPAKGTYGGGRVSWAQVKHNREHKRFLGTAAVVIAFGLRLILGK